MRSKIKQRLEAIEEVLADHVAKLEVVDYGILDDYTGDEWEEVHHEKAVTVFRNNETGEIRGACCDRRSDAQKLSEGGLLEFL
jgi:hypothetical protein